MPVHTAATVDRHHRHRSHFDLEPDESIEQYRATKSLSAAYDDDNNDITIVRIDSKRQLALPIMQHNGIFKRVPQTKNSMGHSSMNQDPIIVWKLVVTVILVLGTFIMLRWKNTIFNLSACTAKRFFQLFYSYRKFLGNLVHRVNRIFAGPSINDDSNQTSNSHFGMVSTNRDRNLLTYASPPSPMKRKCSDGGQASTPSKKTRGCKVVAASSTDQVSTQCAATDHGSDFFTAIGTPLPTDDEDHPSLLDETTIISVTASETIIAPDDLDGTICAISCDIKASAQRAPRRLVHPDDIMHTKLVDAFSQIDKSSIQEAFENATKDALQVYASMTACTMLGVPSEVGAHLALQRIDSELKEQFTRDREIRLENAANCRAESTTAAIRESAPWIVAVHTARDQCLASINNACVLGLAIAAIMFLCDVEHLTMEALSWKNWSWQNLTQCMGCDYEERVGPSSTSSWLTAHVGTQLFSLTSTQFALSSSCVIRNIVSVWPVVGAFFIFTWILHVFHTPILVRQIVGALLLWCNVATSDVVMKTIYQRVLPQFCISLLLSCYIYIQCDAVISKARRSSQREAILIEFRVWIDLIQRCVTCSPLVIGAMFYAVALIGG